MFEDLWNGILELTAKFVIPDWNSVVAMLPVLIFASVVVIATSLKLLRAPKPLRKHRIKHPTARRPHAGSFVSPGLCRDRRIHAVPRSRLRARCSSSERSASR